MNDSPRVISPKELAELTLANFSKRADYLAIQNRRELQTIKGAVRYQQYKEKDQQKKRSYKVIFYLVERQIAFRRQQNEDSWLNIFFGSKKEQKKEQQPSNTYASSLYQSFLGLFSKQNDKTQMKTNENAASEDQEYPLLGQSQALESKVAEGKSSLTKKQEDQETNEKFQGKLKQL